jgi:hypothetical protein
MAIYHFKLKLIRRREGRSAVAAAAYRSADRIKDATTGQTHNYSRKRGVVETGLVGWSAARSDLWNLAEQTERHPRAIVAREIIVALPHELSPVACKALAVGFAGYLRERHGVAVDWAIHAPTQHSPLNSHAHLMLTTRTVDGRTGKFGNKTRELDVASIGRDHVKAWRATWCDRVNERLWLDGIDQALDHRSHVAAGRDKVPARHLGASGIAMERRGVKTAAGDWNRRLAILNRKRRRLRAQLRVLRSTITLLTNTLFELAAAEPERPYSRAR